MTNDQRAEYSLDLTATGWLRDHPNPNGTYVHCRITLLRSSHDRPDGTLRTLLRWSKTVAVARLTARSDVVLLMLSVTELDDRICCKWYEYCISCCIRASPPPPDRDQSLWFSECVNACRTSSATLTSTGICERNAQVLHSTRARSRGTLSMPPPPATRRGRRQPALLPPPASTRSDNGRSLDASAQLFAFAY